MIYISEGSKGVSVINLTVGDDASLTVPLKTDSGTEYTLGPTEYLIFGVRETPTSDSDLLIDIESEPGSNVIEFLHDDTKDLDPGYYSAEIQMIKADGKRITVWPKLTGNDRISTENRKNFCLMTEVVYK